jgi:hypothetical protein
MSRIQVSLPGAALGQLRVLGAATGEPTSRVAARLILAALAGDATVPDSVAPLPQSQRAQTAPRPTRPPVWLQPVDEDNEQDWLCEMWGAIVALRRRYPSMLARLPEGWWRDAQLVEMLSALATWRVNIEAASEDPREEIAFHAALQHVARLLDQTPGSERRFDPDILRPSDWGRAPFG